MPRTLIWALLVTLLCAPPALIAADDAAENPEKAAKEAALFAQVDGLVEEGVLTSRQRKEIHEVVHPLDQPRLVEPWLGTFGWSVITFLIVCFVLTKLAWKPLLKALDEREARIRESLEAADLARAETEQLHKEHQALMAEARKEATAIVEEGKRDAVVVKDGILADARRETEGLATRAKAEIERAKELAVHDLHTRAVEISYQVAEKLIQKSLTREDHEGLVDSTIERYVRS